MKKLLFPILIAAIITPVMCSAEKVTGPKSQQLTVYNGNFALVKDVRTISLSQGINSIEVADVAAKIDPTSILFKSITAPNSVGILEQNYQYDLINPNNILDKSVGQRVVFTRFDESGNPHTQTGMLLSMPSSGGVVIRADDFSNYVVLNPQGQISLERMPEGLHPKPTLNWLLQSSRAGDQDVEISYITDNIGWKADYVALVNEDDTALDLAGWVTLNNQSGASYNDAKLTLMAGDVRRIEEFLPAESPVRAARVFHAPMPPQFEEKSFFEYHMYTMERPTTIRDRETKQLSLLNALNVPVKKEFIYEARDSEYHKVNVILEAINSEKNHMGMPLPKGKMRVYKLDDDGNQQFVGEDEIDHTPKDEKIRLYIGDAFDIVGDYVHKSRMKIADRVEQNSYEVKIRNHKKIPIEIKVVAHAWNHWKVVKSSHGYNKKDAQTFEFPIKVPADGETVVTYTVRTSW